MILNIEIGMIKNIKELHLQYAQCSAVRALLLKYR